MQLWEKSIISIYPSNSRSLGNRTRRKLNRMRFEAVKHKEKYTEVHSPESLCYNGYRFFRKKAVGVWKSRFLQRNWQQSFFRYGTRTVTRVILDGSVSRAEV